METLFKHRNLLEGLVNATSVILLLLMGVTLLTGVFASDIQFWDEATNLQVIVESSSQQDFWNLRYEGGYFWEKPPLFYWIGIVIYKLAGSNPLILPYLMRGLTAIVSFCLITLVFLLLKRRHSASGLIWLAIICMVPFLWQFSPTGVLSTHNLRSADSDTLQLIFMVLCSLAIYKFRANNTWHWLIAAGALAALAIFTKGPLGILPMLLLLITSVSYKPKLKYIIVGLSISLSVTFVWSMLMVFYFGGEFWQQYFIYHQLSRANSALEGHNQPVWFYMSLLLNTGFSGAFPVGFTGAIFLILRKHKVQSFTLVALFISAMSFLMIQFATTKIAWYLLPAVLFGCIFISSVRIKLNLIGVILIYLFAAVSIFSTLFLFISQVNSIQNSASAGYVYFYCSDQSHRVFNFYKTTGVLYNAKEETRELVRTRLYVDLNDLKKCPQIGQGWDIERLVSGNYAILKLK